MPEKAPRETRCGVIVVHAFASYREGQFLDDPAEIDRLLSQGEGWRVAEAVLIDAGM